MNSHCSKTIDLTWNSVCKVFTKFGNKLRTEWVNLFLIFWFPVLSLLCATIQLFKIVICINAFIVFISNFLQLQKIYHVQKFSILHFYSTSKRSHLFLSIRPNQKQTKDYYCTILQYHEETQSDGESGHGMLSNICHHRLTIWKQFLLELSTKIFSYLVIYWISFANWYDWLYVPW